MEKAREIEDMLLDMKSTILVIKFSLTYWRFYTINCQLKWSNFKNKTKQKNIYVRKISLVKD